MNIHLALLIAYSIGIIAFGLWTARFVRGSSDFFVAGRSLGPGLILSSMLAANIGAGSTVGVAGLAYRDGLSAWWWVGSAGIGSMIFAYTVAPRLWQYAADRNFYTTGDYLEFRYGPSVRGLISAVVCIGSLALLAGQLIAGAAILNVITGAPRWAGALIGAVVMTVYFTAGGLLGSAWVNTVQLVIMMVGFLIALPVLTNNAGGLAGLTQPPSPEWFGDFLYSGGPGSGWTMLFLFAPAFIVSPGLIQKSYGAKSKSALSTGIALNAVVLMLFAFIPTLLGMAARVSNPGITDSNTVLPTLLATGLPVWLGALALAAVFSTEVDTCDAVLFMLSTTISQDIYKKVINPAATDAQLLRVARGAAVVGGAAGVVLSIYLATVIGALTIFYSILVVSLFMPIIGGLYWPRAGTSAAIASIIAGLVALFSIRFFVTPLYRWADPALGGLFIAAAVYVIVALMGRPSTHVRSVHA
ncbi:MAG TPA: sodium:solute symporter family protein [Vicinamibacterales bacterium]|nr:sodium:solute symporter family protein [Vicinamibacterales bacterium]